MTTPRPPEAAGDDASSRGTPVGRRVVLAMAGLGAVGIVTGSALANRVSSVAASLPSSVSGLIPGLGGFRFYSVTPTEPDISPAAYQLSVGGLVDRPATLRMADLEALPQTTLVETFQCVTGWTVPGVHWQGVALPDLLAHVGIQRGAKAVLFTSLDGTYTESLTLSQAMRRDVIVATQMLGGPVSRSHGGPVRLYVAPMYGYKSIKWLGQIVVSDRVVPGYWENLGYAVDAWIGDSNGYTGGHAG